jgi:hypothetical protein
VAAWSAAAAIGSVVLLGLGAERSSGTADLVLLAAAMVAVTLVNQVAFIAVLRLAERRTLRQVLVELRPAIVPGWIVGGAVTLTFGLLFAAACSRAPLLAWLLPVPLLALHWASQTYASSRADLLRTGGLHRATRSLVASVEPEDALPAFLEEVRLAFRADAVELVAAEPGGPVVVRAEAAPAGSGGLPAPQPGGVVQPVDADVDLAAALLRLDAPARVTTLSTDEAITAGLRRHGWRDCLVARVPEVGGIRRILCIYDPDGVVGFDRAEVTVVEGLAGEIGGALARADAARALRASEARFRGLVQHSSEMVVVVDASGIVKEALPSTSTPAFELRTGSSITTVAHPDDVGRSPLPSGGSPTGRVRPPP